MPDAIITALVQAGIYGPVVVWFMWRDGKERERVSNREASMHEKIDSTNGKIERMTDALHYLVRVTGMEVMSRPHVVERIKDEAREIVAAVERRSGS